MSKISGLDVGTCFLRHVKAQGYPVTVYSVVEDPLYAYKHDEDNPYAPQERAAVERELKARSAKGLLFVMSYSVLAEDGELEEVHINDVERYLDENQFEQAQTEGWPTV